MQICIEIPPEKEAAIIEILLQKESLAEEQSETPESITSITQEVVVAQEKEKEKENEEPLLNILSDLGLTYNPKGHGNTSNSISDATFKVLVSFYEKLGAFLLEQDLLTLQKVWPKGEGKWDKKIIKDICSFTLACKNNEIQVCFDKLATYLSKKNRKDNDQSISAEEFKKELILDAPGSATLHHYNIGLNEGHKLPDEILESVGR